MMSESLNTMTATNGILPHHPASTTTMTQTKSYASSTLAIHADDRLNQATDVAPALHVSTTFRYSSDPDQLVPVGDEKRDYDDMNHVYTRLSNPNNARLEAILSSLMGGHVLTYASGLAAFHAMVVYLRPNVIAMYEGYHGCHGIVAILARLYGLKKVNLMDESSWDDAGLGKGDIIHVETPLNPTGEAYNLEYFRKKADERGAFLTCDATFAPPPLQDPFRHGVDIIMHSGTKYIGGHSDMLCGVLAMKNETWYKELWSERLLLGGVLGNLEGWLGVRSVRTLELRIKTQSGNAENLASWLSAALEGHGEEAEIVKNTVYQVKHASLQGKDMSWLQKQMPNGYGPVFSIWAKSCDMARKLPSKLQLFHHATSLGGVESLIEWRKMSDRTVDDRVLRLSVGIENWEDLRDDLLAGFKSLLEEERKDKEVNGHS